MNRVKNLVTFFAFALLVLSLPVIASAQWRDNRQNDNYGNGRYNRNLKATVKNLKNRSKQFEKLLDRELDRSRYDDRNREDRLNELAQRFTDATKDLDHEYDNRRDYNESYDEVREVLTLGSRIDRALSRARLSYNVQNQWNMIQQDLRQLANAFNYNDNRNRRNNDNRRNRRDRDNDDYRNSRNDDWRNRIPFPLPF